MYGLLLIFTIQKKKKKIDIMAMHLFRSINLPQMLVKSLETSGVRRTDGFGGFVVLGSCMQSINFWG